MNNLIKYGASESFIAQAALYPDMELARIISQYKDLYKIMTESGERLAEVSGKFQYQTKLICQYPAVGDFVMIDLSDAQSGNAIIQKVLTRKSVFERTAVGVIKQTQVVAANIDVVFICMSLNNDYNPSRLERYLSVAWNSGAIPVIVLTKSDQCEDLKKVESEIADIAIGVEVIITSSFDEASYNKLLPYLKQGATASFIGSSGVGKSTLINRLAAEELLATAAIRQDDKGRHTTTRRELLILPNGSIVIDTPGMRELGVDSVDLSKSFAEIDQLVKLCRFNDCTHTNEPGCAVRGKIESGELDERRFENYQKLQREARYDGLSAKEIENEKIKSMFGSKAEYKRLMDSAKKKNK